MRPSEQSSAERRCTTTATTTTQHTLVSISIHIVCIHVRAHNPSQHIVCLRVPYYTGSATDWLDWMSEFRQQPTTDGFTVFYKHLCRSVEHLNCVRRDFRAIVRHSRNHIRPVISYVCRAFFSTISNFFRVTFKFMNFHSMVLMTRTL